jgi:hypothetical protein
MSAVKKQLQLQLVAVAPASTCGANATAAVITLQSQQRSRAAIIADSVAEYNRLFAVCLLPARLGAPASPTKSTRQISTRHTTSSETDVVLELRGSSPLVHDARQFLRFRGSYDLVALPPVNGVGPPQLVSRALLWFTSPSRRTVERIVDHFADDGAIDMTTLSLWRGLAVHVQESSSDTATITPVLPLSITNCVAAHAFLAAAVNSPTCSPPGGVFLTLRAIDIVALSSLYTWVCKALLPVFAAPHGVLLRCSASSPQREWSAALRQCWRATFVVLYDDCFAPGAAASSLTVSQLADTLQLLLGGGGCFPLGLLSSSTASTATCYFVLLSRRGGLLERALQRCVTAELAYRQVCVDWNDEVHVPTVTPALVAAALVHDGDNAIRNECARLQRDGVLLDERERWALVVRYELAIELCFWYDALRNAHYWSGKKITTQSSTMMRRGVVALPRQLLAADLLHFQEDVHTVERLSSVSAALIALDRMLDCDASNACYLVDASLAHCRDAFVHHCPQARNVCPSILWNDPM